MNTAKPTPCDKKQQQYLLNGDRLAYVLDSTPILPQSAWLRSVFLSPSVSWFTRLVTKWGGGTALAPIPYTPYSNKSLNTLVFMIGIGKNLRLVSSIWDLSGIGAAMRSPRQFPEFAADHNGASKSPLAFNCDLFRTSGVFWLNYLSSGPSSEAVPLLSQEAY
jgi:hypothetical protein